MKKLLYITLGLLILISTASWSCVNDAQSIETVVTDFMTAFEKREYSRCLDYLSTRLRMREGDQQIVNTMQYDVLWSGIKKLKSLGTPTISGNMAEIWIDTTDLLGITTKTVKFSLIKEDGKRKIDDF